MAGMKEWRPRLESLTATRLGRVQACDHPWARRLTSEYRRMYCGQCDVDFELWIVAHPAPDIPKIDEASDSDRWMGLVQAGAAVLMALDGHQHEVRETIEANRTQEGWPAAMRALEVRDALDLAVKERDEARGEARNYLNAIGKAHDQLTAYGVPNAAEGNDDAGVAARVRSLYQLAFERGRRHGGSEVKLESAAATAGADGGQVRISFGEWKRLGAQGQVAKDMHEALGVPWGEDPYRVIKHLRTAAQQLERRGEKVLRTAAEIWDEAFKAAHDFILGGHFLHDDAPPKRFAREVTQHMVAQVKNPYAEVYEPVIARDRTQTPLGAALASARRDTQEFLKGAGAVGVSTMGGRPAIMFAGGGEREVPLQRGPSPDMILLDDPHLTGGGPCAPVTASEVRRFIDETAARRGVQGQAVPGMVPDPAVNPLERTLRGKVDDGSNRASMQRPTLEHAAAEMARVCRELWAKEGIGPAEQERRLRAFERSVNALNGWTADPVMPTGRVYERRILEPGGHATIAELVTTMLTFYAPPVGQTETNQRVQEWLRLFDAAAEEKYGCKASCCVSTAEPACDVAEDVRS